MADHPPPWKWEIRRDGQLGALLDANGDVVLTDDGTYDDAWIGVESPRARELLRAAPEMEALLRDKPALMDPHYSEWLRQKDALLARIDKAAAGG